MVDFTEQSQNVYFAGRLISAEGNAVAVDALGTVRWNSGLGASEYYPYGVEFTATANDTEKYATYTRDSLTGLDYAMNRYYASQWGRFLSPDPYRGSANPDAPQSWNRYAYTGDDPMNANDPTGLGVLDICYSFEEPLGPATGFESSENVIYYGFPAAIIYTTITQCSTVMSPTAGGNPSARALLDARIKHLGNCGKILAGVSASTFLAIANTIQFFNGSPGSSTASLTQDQVSGNGISQSLGATVAGDVADTLVNSSGTPIPFVVLGTDFYSDPNVSQQNVLLHEALHVATGLAGPGDLALKQYLEQFGFRPGYGGAATGGTDDITQWLTDNCPDLSHPTKRPYR